MQLSRRLQSVADLVTKGQKVADIGCDHAYTSIYMVRENIATKVIAMDINKGPLEKAKANVKAYRYQDIIDTRLSDGMKKLTTGEVDALLISGMGGALMIKILSDRLDIFSELKEVILQPQSEIHLVRRFLHEHGYAIVKEIFLKEDGKYYVAMKAKNLSMIAENERVKITEEYGVSYEKECFDYYGKLLLNERNATLYEFLHREITMRKEIFAAIAVNDTDNARKRLTELEHELKVLQDALLFYDAYNN